MIDALTRWWAEWSSYRPIDFLMFSPAIYRRLFEVQNLAWWPLHVPVLAAGALWLGSVAMRPARMMQARALCVALSMLWLFVAWDFLHRRFAPIFWVADGYAVAFALQAFGWLALAAVGGVEVRARGGARRVGFLVGVWALVGHPMLTVAMGRPWVQTPWFGFAPDPTVLGSIACLVWMRSTTAAGRRLRRVLWVVPLSWLVVSGATLATMALG